MKKRHLVPAVAAGLVLATLAGLWLARLPLAGWALERQLAARGLAGSAEVVRLEPGGATLRDLELEGQRIERLVLDYRLGSLLGEGAIDSVRIEGARLAADLTAERPLGGLSALFEGEASEEAPPLSLPRLPPVELEDVEIALETARGPVRLALYGGLRAAEPDEGARRIALDLSTLEGPVDLAGRLQGLYRPGDGSGSAVTLALESRSGPPLSLAGELAIEAGAEGEGAPDGRQLEAGLELSGDAALLAELAALPASVLPESERPTAGSLAAGLSFAGPLAPLLDGEPTAWLLNPQGLDRLDLALYLDALDLPGRARGFSLDSGLNLAGAREAGGRGLRLEPTTLAADSLDRAWLAGLGLPSELAAALAAGGRLAISGDAAPPAVLRLADAAPARLELDLLAALAPSAGGRAALSLEGALEAEGLWPATGGDLLAALAPGRLDGRLSAGDLVLASLGRLGRLEAPFVLEVGGAAPAVTLEAPLELEELALEEPLLQRLDAGWRPLLGEPLDLTLGGATAGQLTLEGKRLRVALPGRLALDAGTAELSAELDGWLLLGPTGPLGGGALEDGGLEIAALQAAALPTPYGRIETLSASGRVEGIPGAAAGRLRAALSLADLAVAGTAATDLEAELAAELTWDDAALVLSLSEPGRLRASELADLVDPRLQAVELELADGRLALTAAETRLELAGALAPARFDLDGRGSVDDLVVSAPDLALSLVLPEGGEAEGELRTRDAEARFTDAGLRLSGLALAATLDGAGRRIELSEGRAASTAEPPLFPALSLGGSAEEQDGALTFRLRGRGLSGALRLAARGSQDLSAGRGRVAVTLEPLEFSPGGLQPGALTPALAELERARGRVSGSAELRLGGALDGSLRLALQDIGFTVAGTEVAGLQAELALDGLDPPTTAGAQAFSIERVDVGVPLTDVEGRLRLVSAEGATEIVVEQAEAAFLDGRLALEGAVLDPAARRYDLTLQVERVDLSRLLALTGLEEVSGDGRLSGEIPVTLADGKLVIRDGALDALSPGVIAFKSEEAKQALASGGQSVELMLQALEDFHYDVLRLTLDKPAEGESRVFLKLEGNNPEVLQGQPFVLNINLTSNAAPLLAALARGTEISDRLVEELLQSRQR